MACAASTERRSTLDRRWRLAPQVAVRPEPFGALVYHFGTRRLTFLKSRLLLDVVGALAGHDSARDACRAAGVAEDERGADVLLIEGVLEGQRGGAMPFDQLGDSLVQLVKAEGERRPPRQRDGAALDEAAETSVVDVDHAVPRHRGARVDSEHPHVTRSPPPSPRHRCRSSSGLWRRRPSLPTPR